MNPIVSYKEVPLSGAYSHLSVKVSPEDYDLVSKYRWWGCWTSSIGTIRIYGDLSTDNKRVSLARLVMGMTDKDSDVLIDHKNMNQLDCTRDNLRLCNKSQNGANSCSRGGSSKFKGVSWHKPTCKWKASITKYYRSYYLGVFDDEYDAAEAYNKAAVKLFGEFAQLNLV
jgi:hypothetical protein